MRTIVVSAVNIVEAGPLVILKDCLRYLSELGARGDYRIVALVYRRELADFDHIEYIETQWPKRNWLNRLWYEYVSMRRISEQIGPVYLWFSLHDTSPRVQAERQAVYCHNSFSFYKWRWRELRFAPKIVLFSLFTKYIYAYNITANKYLVVQQDWFRKEMSRSFGFSVGDIIVAKPQRTGALCVGQNEPTSSNEGYTFLFPASPNSHKNFECLCAAVAMLEMRRELPKFKVYITIRGDENAYTRWIFKKWGGRYDSLAFIGFLTKEGLYQYYERTNCLVFPSKTESWGLPISEFADYGKPMLLADMPYARETAAGSRYTAFFDPDNPGMLAECMAQLIQGEVGFLDRVIGTEIDQPVVAEWPALFDILLND